MKNILLLLCTTVLGMIFNSHAQNVIDYNGNSSANNSQITSVKSLTSSARITSTQPNIINSFPSPTVSPNDIAFDGVNLWVEGFEDLLLYKVSPINGTILKTIPTNIRRPYGLEFANGFLWVADTDNKLIQQVDTSNGNVISSFPTPCRSSSSYPGGLAWDGQNLWHNDNMGTSANPYDSTYKITTNGQLIHAYHALGTAVTGLAWDGNYLWSSDNASLKIYKIDVSTFTIVEMIDAPGGLYPNGLAFDGQYLWVINNDTDYLYQIDIGLTTRVTQNKLTNPINFSIYPNPSSDEITIKLSNSDVGSTYVIIDHSGKEIMNGKLSNTTTTININQLAVGVYMFQVGENVTQSFKVIKK